MARTLKFNLLSQSQIPKEGKMNEGNANIAVGQRRVEFFVPNLEKEVAKTSTVAGEPSRIQTIVDKINQYIDNIADDYFLLGLHLIALHRMLKQSDLTIDQIKMWYTENINMPYSSAMQCRKVAEIYEHNPELINRYTASGAYLLSSCATQEEREEIWNEARGDKPAATVREVREVLKRRREQALLEASNEEEDSVETIPLPVYCMAEQQVFESLTQLTTYASNLAQSKNPDDRLEMRQALIKAVEEFLQKVTETI